MDFTCLNCRLILDDIAAPPEADEFVNLLCQPELEPGLEEGTPRRAGRPVLGSRPAPG